MVTAKKTFSSQEASWSGHPSSLSVKAFITQQSNLDLALIGNGGQAGLCLWMVRMGDGGLGIGDWGLGIGADGVIAFRLLATVRLCRLVLMMIRALDHAWRCPLAGLWLCWRQ
jgi:hypothetical protein